MSQSCRPMSNLPVPSLPGPHLGHLYTLVVSDAYFRFQKLLQNHKHYVFATGTDEHGLKVFDLLSFCFFSS